MRRVQPWPQAQQPPLSTARSELWIPRPALASCVRGMIARDTRGVVLSTEQRCNRFPAAPTCALLWYLQGSAELLWPGAEATSRGTPIAPVTLCGPFSRPTVSVNPGPVHAFMVLLMPDALTRLTGLDLAPLVDRIVPVEQVFDAPWLDLCQAVADAPDDEQRVARVAAFLLPRWRDLRPQAPFSSHRLADWAHSLALHAATSGLGRSLRQAQRRLERWTGSTYRELRCLGRSERSFFHGVAAYRSGRVDWAQVAEESGYADQSHLTRECRRITGLPPAQLLQRVADDESYWVYRLWGFDVDGDAASIF